MMELIVESKPNEVDKTEKTESFVAVVSSPVSEHKPASEHSFHVGGTERITAANMEALCCATLKLDLTPINIPNLLDEQVITEDTFLSPHPAENVYADSSEAHKDAVAEPCIPLGGKTLEDNPDYFWGSKIGPSQRSSDPTLSADERYYLAKYSCLNREQLAELREAFLLFSAVHESPSGMTESLLHWTDFGRCLRVVGQNPSRADLVHLTKPFVTPVSMLENRMQIMKSLDIDEIGPLSSPTRGSMAENRRRSTTHSVVGRRRSSVMLAGTSPLRRRPSSMLKMRPSMSSGMTPTRRRSTLSMAKPRRSSLMKVGRRRSSASVTGQRRQSSSPSMTRPHSMNMQYNTVDGSKLITLDEYLTMCNMYGKQMRPESNLAKDLEMALRVFDNEESGLINSSRLRQALQTYGEAMDDMEINALFEFMGDALHEDGQIDYEVVFKKLTAV